MKSRKKPKIEEAIPEGDLRNKVSTSLIQIKQNYVESKKACIDFIDAADKAYQSYNQDYRFSAELHEMVDDKCFEPDFFAPIRRWG